jgi:hypothetical protein
MHKSRAQLQVPPSLKKKRLEQSLLVTGSWPMQLKQKRLCEGLRGEHAVFDHAPHCAPISCSDGDHTVFYDVPARYALAIEILNTDLFTHDGELLRTETSAEELV